MVLEYTNACIQRSSTMFLRCVSTPEPPGTIHPEGRSASTGASTPAQEAWVRSTCAYCTNTMGHETVHISMQLDQACMCAGQPEANPYRSEWLHGLSKHATSQTKCKPWHRHVTNIHSLPSLAGSETEFKEKYPLLLSLVSCQCHSPLSGQWQPHAAPPRADPTHPAPAAQPVAGRANRQSRQLATAVRRKYHNTTMFASCLVLAEA